MARTPDPRASSAPADPRSDAASLRAFVAVARQGTVGAAAKVLGRTQPSVSARLAALERAWGSRLFRRLSRGMALTPEGARLLPLAETALGHLEALDRAAGIEMLPAHELRVGAGDALGRDLLPRAVAQLLRELPQIEIRILEGSGNRLLEALRAGEIDLALLLAPEAPRRLSGFETRPLLASAIRLLAPARLRLPGGALSFERVARERLVLLHAASEFRRRIERAFNDRGLQCRPAVEVGNFSLVRRFVAAGLGIAPVPEIAFAETEALVQVRRLSGAARLHYVGVSREGSSLPRAAARLVETIAGISPRP